MRLLSDNVLIIVIGANCSNLYIQVGGLIV